MQNLKNIYIASQSTHMTQQEREMGLATALEPIHRSANWFYWIIGLSLVNLALAVAESDSHFLIGLAMSDVGAAFITDKEGGTTLKVVGGIIVFLVISTYLILGRKAHKPSKLAFIIGIVLYTIDGLIYLAVQDFLSAAFHAYVIYNFWVGFKALDTYFLIYNHEITEPEPVAEDLTLQPVTSAVENGTPVEEDPYKPVV